MGVPKCPRWPQSGFREYPAHRPGRQLDRLVGFGQAFGQVDRVEAGKRTRSRLDYPTATEFARPIDRTPTPVAVDESGGSLGPQPFGQPLDLTFGKLQGLRRNGGIQLPGENMG